MDKNAIRTYAVWARQELISRVSRKAMQYGISKQGISDKNADIVNGRLLTENEKKQRKALIDKINEKGFDQVIEEVAYTWFNRFSALRFMEVNGYLPAHIRVFTDEDNNFKPQILTEAIHLEMEGLDIEKVYQLKETDQTEELYKYLLITKCNALSKILPGMFQRIADYTELLFPDNLLREGSIIEQMIALIPQKDWKDAVQIIGWLYQYYNSELKDRIFGDLKRNIKISRDDIPAATQLFTPDWIVRYMVENSLGRLWLEGHPDDRLKAGWKFYLDEAEQDAEVQAELGQIREKHKTIRPEEIRCIDPCMGSGHILVYMFDVLIKIYESYGFNQREAVKSILENNLYGLDIDDRAAQLAYFSVMMKALQYDKRLLRRAEIPQPHVYAIRQSNHLDKALVESFTNGDPGLESDMQILMDDLHDAGEYGSILNASQVNFAALYSRFEAIREEKEISLYRQRILAELLPLVQMAQVLANKYHVLVTNPPYMSSSGMNLKLKQYIRKNYPNSRSDLSAVFMERCSDFAYEEGLYAMITQHSWMFLPSYENLRNKLMQQQLISMVHQGARAFEEISGEVVQAVSFVMSPHTADNYKSVFVRLVDYNTQQEKENEFANQQNCYTARVSDFTKMPGKPYSYWASKKTISAFVNSARISDFGDARQGMATGNNSYFVRFWYEICFDEIAFSCKNYDEFQSNGCKYVPYTKSAGICKWYGNYFNVLKFDQKHYELLSNSGNCLPSRQYYFRKNANWSLISTDRFGARFAPEGTVFDVGAHAFFGDGNVIGILGYLNCVVFTHFIKFLSPTLNYNSGIVAKVPAPEIPMNVTEIVEKNIEIAKNNWDSYELSWDFRYHPLIEPYFRNKTTGSPSISLRDCFLKWEQRCMRWFSQLKSNEEELNRIFISLYGLEDELTPELEDKEVSVRRADYTQDIKSLISYAVGCMFGRYSLDDEGLVHGGGEWDSTRYRIFPADQDNIIPISEDEYFKDDIVARFIRFVETVFGAATLEDNLQFIADALRGKGTSREVIRNYFINDFYADHCKTYQKHPIYWLFDSGKKNGFKALIYLHRYQPDTIARMRTDYVHEQQARYRTAIETLQQRIRKASTDEHVKLNQQLIKLQDQAEELRVYEEKIHHLADQMLHIDLDEGVKHNYGILRSVLAKI
ncbi:MAG: BREX-1 system adenine-specific DNA-methyltransferase PglX [Clostridiaceae bacterium]|nr:BREX-1 system adenine-specific DNA-methyltransferase PglX [Clostridiaceae bacterium]